MSHRLATGIKDFDSLVQSGLPLGSDVVVQGPHGRETLRFALAFLAEGLKAGAGGLVVGFAHPPEAILEDLHRLGVNLDRVLVEGRLRIIDRRRRDTAAEGERGADAPSGLSRTNLLELNTTLSHALASLRGAGPKRAVIEALSPLADQFGVSAARVFAQTAKHKFDRLRVTSLFILDTDRLSSANAAYLSDPFDGVIAISRSGEGDSVAHRIGILRLNETRPQAHSCAFPSPEQLEGLARSKGSKEPTRLVPGKAFGPCPVCEASIETGLRTCPTCGLRFVHRSAPASPHEPPTTQTIEPPSPRNAEVEGAATGALRTSLSEESRKDESRLGPEAAGKLGLTNGLVLERTRPRPPGMTNGLGGRTNGLTNGIGRTNGLTNGVGRTNGLTQEVGRTNGLASPGTRSTISHPSGFRRTARRVGWRWYLIPLVGATILLIPLVYVPDFGGPHRPIQIDGQFSDWPTTVLVAQSPSTTASPNVDLRRIGMVDNGDRLAFYVEVDGQVLSGGGVPLRHDSLRVFLDIDRDSATGYHVSGIGAERMAAISGSGGRVAGASLFEWDSGRAVLDWNGWTAPRPISAAAVGTRLEFEVSWDLLATDASLLRTYFHVQAHDSSFDESDFAMGLGSASLVVDATPIVAESIAGPDVSLLRVDITSYAGPSSFSSLRATVVGTAPPTSVASVRLVDATGGTLHQTSAVSREITFPFPSRSLAIGQTETLYLRADVAGSTGETLGLTIAAPGDVVANAVVTVRQRPSPRNVGYVGFVPMTPVVDGGFAEWTNTSADPSEIGRRPEVDLRGYGALRDATSLYLFTEVGGRGFAGVIVPQVNGLVVTPSGVPDSDRDTVPDGNDPFPLDFNNDGTGDAASAGDVDGDGMADYPFGGDWYLNTTIPATFPPPYANRAVSLFIGPAARPPLYGEDVARVFIDSDDNASTGFRVNVLGADFLTEIRGRSSVLTARVVSEFAGSSSLEWNWNPILPLSAEKDYARLEVSIPSAALGFGNRSVTYFEVMDWALDKDASVDPILQVDGATSGSPVPASSPGAVHTLDLPSNEKWFFTNTNSAEAVCTSNKDASLSAGAAAASTTLSAGQSICWYSPDGQPDTLAGVWEVILDIGIASDGIQTFMANANGDVNGWSAVGCAEASEFLCVDDDPNDGDGTYIDSVDAAPLDSLFNLPDWGSPPSPLSATVTVEASCRRTGGAPVDVRVMLKSAGTTSVGSTAQNCANSMLYSVWSETWPTDPADGGPWTATDINGLQVGVRDNDATTRDVRVSHVKAIVTFAPVYSVAINKCENAGCTITTNLYPATNFNAFGSDVTITTGGIPAQTLVGQEHIQWKVTLVSGGTVTIRYNGPYPGTDDSRATVSIPEFEALVVPLTGVLALVAIALRSGHRKRRKK